MENNGKYETNVNAETNFCWSSEINETAKYMKVWKQGKYEKHENV